WPRGTSTASGWPCAGCSTPTSRATRRPPGRATTTSRSPTSTATTATRSCSARRRSTIDDDGTLAYATGLGHGDAMHVSDLVPSNDGLEVFAVHECMDCSSGRGATMRDAATGEILWSIPATRDTGRGAAADIDPPYPGAEGRAVGSGEWDDPTGYLMSADGERIGSSIPAANFVVQWDADLLYEIADHVFDDVPRTGDPYVYDWDHEAGEQVEIFAPEGVKTNND